MSWRDRVTRVVRDGLNSVQDRVVEFEEDGGWEAFAQRVARRLEEHEDRLLSGQHQLNPQYQRQLRLWYARLEIPYGSGEREVRTAFRAMMRKYHPDRFTKDEEMERLATQVAQELTVAYEGLLAHLRG